MRSFGFAGQLFIVVIVVSCLSAIMLSLRWFWFPFFSAGFRAFGDWIGTVHLMVDAYHSGYYYSY